MANILIYGGSFDPIHNGHIKVAKKIKKALSIDKVVFELAKAPRWKTPNVDSFHRLNMLKIALEPYKDFDIDLYEFDSKEEVNYSYNTILYFKKKYPNDKLFFLIGYDQLNKFHDWYNADELSKLVQVMAYNRKTNEELNIDNIKKYNIKIINGPYYNVSSTRIRDFKSIDVNPNVLRYILDNRLYFAKEIQEYLSIDRYNHSVEVALLAKLIAHANKLNDFNAFKIGLLHDIGKEVDLNQSLEIMNKHFKEYVNYPKFSYHQFVGSYLAYKDFGVNKKEELEAIEYHATGKKDMSPLGMVIYASDKIEPTRGFDSRKLIEGMIKDYYQGFVEVLKANKIYLLEHGKDIYNQLTLDCMNQYLK